jgi:hypothetical protein
MRLKPGLYVWQQSTLLERAPCGASALELCKCMSGPDAHSSTGRTPFRSRRRAGVRPRCAGLATETRLGG